MNSFKRTLKATIAIDILLGALLLLWPGVLAAGGDWSGGGPGAWPRGAGLLLALLALALVPAAILPLANRYLALLGAGAQFLVGGYFLFSGAAYWWALAAYGFVTSFLLVATFWRGFRDDLMAKP